MPAASGGGAADVRPRAGTPLVLGSMTLVAVVVVGLLVAGMRMSEARPEPEPGIVEDVPTVLAGGLPLAPVPAVIAAVADGPVVGALVTDTPPEGMPATCEQSVIADDPTTRVSVVVSPDTADLVVIGPPDPDAWGGEPDAPEAVPDPPVDDAPRAVDQCSWTPSGGGWTSTGGMSGMLDDHMGDMGIGSSCCEGGFGTASSTLVPPDGSAWALQDRGGYWLAYEVADLELVTVSWRFRSGPFGNGRSSSRVLWLDAEGTVLAERSLST